MSQHFVVYFQVVAKQNILLGLASPWSSKAMNNWPTKYASIILSHIFLVFNLY